MPVIVITGLGGVSRKEDMVVTDEAREVDRIVGYRKECGFLFGRKSLKVF